MESKNITDYLVDASDMMLDYKKVISENYFNSTVVFNYENLKVNFPHSRDSIIIPKIDFKLEDIISCCALINTPIAIIGSTGSGKSYLADIMAHCLFGDEFAEKTINPNLGIMDFVDPAYKKLLESETKTDYVKMDKILEKPCLIFNELNRVPSILQNFFLGILEGQINLYSVNFKTGKKLDNNKYYNFIISTMNEGAGYSGISDVDNAIRDRIGIEIGIDNYDYNDDGSTTEDLLKQLNLNTNKKLINAQKGHAKTIYNIKNKINEIPIDIDSILFLQNLNWMNKCVKSHTKTKRSVPRTSLAKLCSGCEYAKEYNSICNNYYKPSKRAFNTLLSFSKSVAFMKAVKVYNFCGENNVNFNELKYNLEVTLDDMLLSSPFVLAGKTEMNPKWLSEYYQGNKEFASKDVANHIKKEILEARDIYEHINNENAESRLKIELFKKKRFGNDIIMFLEKYVKDE